MIVVSQLYVVYSGHHGLQESIPSSNSYFNCIVYVCAQTCMTGLTIIYHECSGDSRTIGYRGYLLNTGDFIDEL